MRAGTRQESCVHIGSVVCGTLNKGFVNLTQDASNHSGCDSALRPTQTNKEVKRPPRHARVNTFLPSVSLMNEPAFDVMFHVRDVMNDSDNDEMTLRHSGRSSVDAPRTQRACAKSGYVSARSEAVCCYWRCPLRAHMPCT